jgi:hypothetical protein
MVDAIFKKHMVHVLIYLPNKMYLVQLCFTHLLEHI